MKEQDLTKEKIAPHILREQLTEDYARVAEQSEVPKNFANIVLDIQLRLPIQSYGSKERVLRALGQRLFASDFSPAEADLAIHHGLAIASLKQLHDERVLFLQDQAVLFSSVDSHSEVYLNYSQQYRLQVDDLPQALEGLTLTEEAEEMRKLQTGMKKQSQIVFQRQEQVALLEQQAREMVRSALHYDMWELFMTGSNTHSQQVRNVVEDYYHSHAP